MSIGIIQRLAVRLRSGFPEAVIQIEDSHCLNLRASIAQQHVLRVRANPTAQGFHIIETTLDLKFDSLVGVGEFEILKLVAAENAGLRGATVIFEPETRHLQVRCAFLGAQGRSKDEAENLMIDVLSILRFTRLLEDRIIRSTAAGAFCFEMYNSQYSSKIGGRNRYVNYARSIFRGSVERLMGESCRVLKTDHAFDVRSSGPSQALLSRATNDFQIQLRVPDEIPMLVLSARLKIEAMDARRAYALVNRLNQNCSIGHFEVTMTAPRMACTIGFVNWKHMTNDLRLYAVDHLVATVIDANDVVITDRKAPVQNQELPLESDLVSWIAGQDHRRAA